MGKSRCRNEAIAEAFHYMHIIESWGTGIPRLYNRCAEYGLAKPLFEEFGDGIKVTMYRKASNANEKVSNANIQYLTAHHSQNRVMCYFFTAYCTCVCYNYY